MNHMGSKSPSFWFDARCRFVQLRPRPLSVPLLVRAASGIITKKPNDQPKKKKSRTHFMNHSLKGLPQFALCDAMRYIKAYEVGQEAKAAKYDLAIRLNTLKNGPVVRNRIRLPNVVNTSLRICVICPPDSPIAKTAIAAGASLVGEESIFEDVKAGRINFQRCLCHADSTAKLNAAGLGRILGPKGLMPSVKMGTVTKDVGGMVRNMVGGTEYRERMGVIRGSVGQLAFTPEQMQKNIQAFMASVKKDIAGLSDRISKEVHEVVLSSTRSPGFSLNGQFQSTESLPLKDLSVLG